MKLRIITWNARGGAITDDAKRQNFIDMVKDCCNSGLGLPIFFIQEAGTMCDMDGLELYRMEDRVPALYNYRTYEPYYACNKRCTLAILYPVQWEALINPYPLRSEQANRPLGAILFAEKIVLATIHATARPETAQADVLAAIDVLKSGSYLSLLIGDMNCEPSTYVNNLCSAFYVADPKVNTHNDEKCYDYAIVENDNNVSITFAGTGNSMWSDHVPVYYNLDLAFI